MSTITTVNLHIKFTDDLPKEILEWLVLNNTISELDETLDYDYADFEKSVPNYILENADRCSQLNGFGARYSFSNNELDLLSSHKNKDHDWEKFINYIMPYIDKENSLGFTHNDYGDSVFKIMFIESEEADILVKEIISSRCDNNNCEIYIDIDGDIDYLERLYKEGNNE